MTRTDVERFGPSSGVVDRARWILQRAIWLVPFAYYVPLAIGLVIHTVSEADPPGGDARIYKMAADAFVAGRDPWGAGMPWAHFPGTPSALLLYSPSAFIPDPLFSVLAVLGTLALAAFVVRRLDYPWAWLLFGPLFDAIRLGQPGVLMLALLLTRFAPLAPLVKPFAALPLVGRWRPLLLAGLAASLTVVAAPGVWADYIARLPELTERLIAELHLRPDPLVIGAGLVGIAVIAVKRRDEAPWLAIPALWPAFEYHYGIVVLPLGNPALLLAFGYGGIPAPLVVLIYALWIVIPERVRQAIAGPVRDWAWLGPLRLRGRAPT